MDKKNTLLGVTFLAIGLGFMVWQAKHQPPAPPPAAAQPVATATAQPEATGSTSAPTSSSALAPVSGAAATAQTDATAKVLTLANELVEYRLTDFGGAIQDVELKKHADHLDPVTKKPVGTYVLNKNHAEPALTLLDFPGLDHRTRYDVVSATPTEVVFRAVFENKIEVTRRYTLAATSKTKDPYTIRHETTLRNLTDSAQVLPRVLLSVGTAAPTGSDDHGIYLSTGYKTGGDFEYTKRDKLRASGGFLGLGAHPERPVIETPAKISWSSVSNQFFAAIYTPDEPAQAEVTRLVKLGTFPDTKIESLGIAGAARFELAPLAAQAEIKLAGTYYAGPKEYRRLSNGDIFKNDEDKVMDYGFFFGWAAAILSTLMSVIHDFVGHWGMAIILATLTIKVLTIPLTFSAQRSMKRMAKLQPEMQALREKYKDNPQKAQLATMELFKERKVNPLGGCIPMLLPMPFFIGFFSMLPVTSELRYQSFLWAHDLAASDTVGYLWGLPIRILPVLLGITIIVQMRMTPQMPATTEQAEMQQKMMKFMPYVFAAICYLQPAALSLYSTTNGLFTIAQQWFINRMKDPEDTAKPAVATTGKRGKPMKNVTPKKN